MTLIATGSDVLLSYLHVPSTHILGAGELVSPLVHFSEAPLSLGQSNHHWKVLDDQKRRHTYSVLLDIIEFRIGVGVCGTPRCT